MSVWIYVGEMFNVVFRVVNLELEEQFAEDHRPNDLNVDSVPSQAWNPRCFQEGR